MPDRISIGRFAQCVATLAAALSIVTTTALRGLDDARHPDLKGQWHRPISPGPFDPSSRRRAAKRRRSPQNTSAVFEANLKDMAEGGQGNYPTFTCLVPGMPAMMTGYEPMEIIVLPEVTHILHGLCLRRPSPANFTDGRDLPTKGIPSSRATPSAAGSTAMATGGLTCSSSRPAISRARAPTTEQRADAASGQPVRSSGSGSFSTRRTATPCATRSRSSTMR